MKKLGFVFFLFLFVQLDLVSQSFYFGPKGGLTIGTQRWEAYSTRRPLLNIHADLFIESYSPEKKGSFYGQLGYHTRGSSIRFINTLNLNSLTQGYSFNNLSLILGVKSPVQVAGRSYPSYFYSVGIRGEYTLFTNLEEFLGTVNANFFPLDQFVRKFMYGINISGGILFDKREFVQPFIEFSLQPDLSPQYDQYFDITTTNPWTGQPQIIRANKIRNVSFEVSFAVKFLRKVIYE